MRMDGWMDENEGLEDLCSYCTLSFDGANQHPYKADTELLTVSLLLLIFFKWEIYITEEVCQMQMKISLCSTFQHMSY